MDITETMRLRVAHELERRGMSQRDLARASGVHETTVSWAVTGVRPVDATTIVRLLEALEIRVTLRAGVKGAKRC